MEKNINKNEYPLTESQFGIYLECIDESNPSNYLIPLSFEFKKDEIDCDKLAKAFLKVADTYSAFKTVIKTVNAAPVMTLSSKEVPCLNIVKTVAGEVKAHKDALFTPFAFDGGFLWRGEILETPEKIILALVFHHTVFDGSSISVLNKALAKAYNGEELSEDGTLYDAQIKEEALQNSPACAEAYEYFDKYFDGLESDSNIIPDLASAENLPEKLIFDIPVSSSEIKKFAKANDITENIVFTGAFSYALSKFNNQNDVVFSSVESGRFGGGFDNSIGMFVKSFPLRFLIDENISSSDFLKSVKENFFATLSHNKVKFSDLVRDYSGCADVRFIYQGELVNGIPVGGAVPEVDLIESYEPVSNFDALVFKIHGEYKLWLGYKNGIYTSGMISAFYELFCTVLSEIITDKKLCEFSLVSEKSKAFLEKENNNEFSCDRSLTVRQIFNDAATKYPDNIAVSYLDKKLTYRELADVTDKIGAYLSKKGIGKDDYIPVLIPRNEFMPICAMGIIKAGAAYQPLDPTYPEERLNFMVTDSKARILIADRNLTHLLSDYKGEILYTDEIEKLKNEPYSVKDAPENALLLIYTSGTTGTPKGCIIENKNVVALFESHKRLVELSEKSRIATVASFGFDAGAMDILTTLMTGAGLYIVPDEIKLDLPQVERFYNENGITNGFMTTQLGRMFLEKTMCKTLKHFVLGGEKLVPFTPPKWVNCHNDYGPSEAIAYVCGFTIKDNSIIQPIGKPCINVKMYIVDAFGRRLPKGCSGELCIAGPQVGRGYLNRPEKTAEAFVKNPFSKDDNYSRLYKTGDIVRMLPSGDYDFIGRRDGQVKIRGFRIELTEVEQVIREYEGIKNATVQAYDDNVSGKFIAAFVVSDATVDIDGLNAFIASQKPAYMIPAVTMQIAEIPLNANAKVDKRKLPKPERIFKESVKPQNEVQRAIFDMVANIVGTEEFGVDTDLYLAGLSSIGSIKLCSLLAERFSKSVQMKDLRQNNTVLKLEEFLAIKKEAEKREELSDYPLTKTQEGILFECISKPESTFYNIPLLLKISKNIDINRLKTAIVKVVEAHPYIKTELFTAEDGSIRAKKAGLADFMENDIEVAENADIEIIKKTAVSPFELLNSRLFRVKIFRSDENYLFTEIHHIIADGTSLNIIISDIEKAYMGEKTEPEEYSSFELAYDEEQNRKTEMLSEAENFYKEELSGLDMNFLPGFDRLPSQKKSNGVFVTAEKHSNAKSVREFCEKNKLSENGLLCAVFGFVLAKYAGTDYSVFNTVYNGRNDSRTEKTVGMLVKTLPVVCNIDKEKSLDIAKEVSKSLIDSMANDIYSFAEICKNYGTKNDIVFVYQGDGFNFDCFCNEKAEKISVELSESKAPLTLEVAIEDGKFRFISEYNPEFYTEELIKTFVNSFDKAISSFVSGEDVSNISLLTDEITKKLDSYNATEVYYDESKTIPALFAENALRFPDKPCVVFKDKEITYKKAFDICSKIASYLMSKQIGKDDIVSILIHRDENMILGAHGVEMTGAAYLGIDPTYPKERINFMLKDSGTKIAVVDRTLSNLIEDFDGEILYTDEFETLPEPKENFLDCIKKVGTDNTALIVYSSGTTGVPKGAALSQRSIVCFFENYVKDMNISDTSRIAMYASFGFDGGAQDVFSAPMSGATLYIIPDDIRLDMEKLEQFYIQNKITSGFMTTQVGTMFIGNTKCKTLTHFAVGGEKFIPTLPPSWVTLYNGYGPSETMCYVNLYKAADTGLLQPIGKTNRNIKEYIVDKFGNRLPFGACGELCIAGAQVGKGYLNRPEKTAAAFVENPFCDTEPYNRLYKTGDIVRQIPDGNYVFEGRRDGQVKIRGFRVELTEIEQVIREFDGIKNSVVQAYDSPSGGKYLAAYIVSNSKIDISKLNEFILSKKPEYMVPAVTMQIDEIPLNSNGKVDKKKLPAPIATNFKKGIEPANETEEAICSIFEDVLGIDKVYADDDFFKIGGSSISAIKVVVKCNNAGYNIVFKNLFSNSTPHALSEHIQGCREEIVYAPKDGEKDKFDYGCLKYNTLEYVNEITSGDIGDVLLTGSTGFLGSHILKELLDNTSSNVVCLVRGKGDMSAETRFEMMMTYYFEDWYTEEKRKRVSVIDGELCDAEALKKIKKYRIDTIINSAANVKHFSAGDDLMKDNYSGVENMIKLAEEIGAVLVQISSTSVSGEAAEGRVSDDFLFRESDLNIGQSLENKYVYSKYLAEQAIIDAISRGKIRGKIIRLGNLMARNDDSEFQINAGSSGFLKQFSAYKKLAMFPVDLMDKEIEFSPIDSTAKAVVMLSGTPEKFTVFHAKNCNTIHYGYFINAMKQEGIDIKITDDETFASVYQKALNDESGVDVFSSLIAYKDGGDKNSVMHQIESDATFTTKALYRLGFAWPLVSSDYLEKMVKTLIELGFFS